MLDGVEDVQPTHRQVVASAPCVRVPQPAAQGLPARHRYHANPGAVFHLTAQQVQPVSQAALAYRRMPVPQRTPVQAPQDGIDPQQAVGIDPYHQQLSLGGEYPLNFTQYLVGVGGEIETVVSDHRIDTVAFEGQLIRRGQQVDALPAAFGYINAMIYRAVAKQWVSTGTADLQQVIAKGRVEYIGHGRLAGPQQVLATVACIPGFQFRQNVDTLTCHSLLPSQGPIPGIGAAAAAC